MSRVCVGVFILFVAVVSIAAQPAVGVDFFDVVSNRSSPPGEKTSTSKTSKHAFNKVCPVDKNPAAKKVLVEYGAMFVASAEIVAPPQVLGRRVSL